MAEKGTSVKDGEMTCKTCSITFPDIYTYTSHLESKEHVKGSMKKKYGEKYLEAKAQLLSKTVDTSVTIDTDSDENDDSNDEVYTCDICQKICTGSLSFKLHLAGTKHRKTLNKLKLMKQMRNRNIIPASEGKDKTDVILQTLENDTKFASSGIICKICGITCSGPESFKQHVEGNSHKKKLAMKEYIHEKDGEKSHGDYSCDICKKTFSGPLPYQQHSESISHLKQKEHLEQLNQFKDLIVTSEEDRNIQCKECGKYFSGTTPFKNHLKSTIHEKLKKRNDMFKELELKYPEMLKGFADAFVDSDDSEEQNIIGCKVCHVSFTGPESARAHFISVKHKKKEKKMMKFEKLNSNIKSKEKPTSINNSVEDFEVIPELGSNTKK